MGPRGPTRQVFLHSEVIEHNNIFTEGTFGRFHNVTLLAVRPHFVQMQC
jgi:hypothetical protein